MARPKSKKHPWFEIKKPNGIYRYIKTPGGLVRLHGEPGAAAFERECAAALTQAPIPVKPRRSVSTLESVVDGYLDSPNFLACKKRTQQDYRLQARVLAKEFGTLDVSALADATDEMRGLFLDHRDRIAKGGLPLETKGGVSKGSLRQADYFLQFLNTVLRWGKKRGKIVVNPFADDGIEKIYSVSRAEKIWSDEQIDNFRSRASKQIELAMVFALWTGQRQGDLLALTWADYDGSCFKLKQGKNGARVQIPVAKPLKKLLDNLPRLGASILVNQSGKAWTADGFRTMWGKTAKRVGIVDRTFHDLRGTAVVKLAVAGCNAIQITSITGHKLSQVRTILEEHYLAHDPRVARQAITMLETSELRQKNAAIRLINHPQPIDIIEADSGEFIDFRQ